MKTICVDVDGTLLIWPEPNPGVVKHGKTPKVNTKVFNRIIELSKAGYTVIVWSATGKEHAENAVKICGLDSYVSLACAKPLLFIDDHYRWMDRIVKESP